jgi:hypothetical protein
MSADYKRLMKHELKKLQQEGDSAAGAELERRRTAIRLHKEKAYAEKAAAATSRAVGRVQAEDAIRAREDVTLERMMELLVDLKTAVASLEAKIEKMIGGDDQEH